jgi:hypothetical protein
MNRVIGIGNLGYCFGAIFVLLCFIEPFRLESIGHIMRQLLEQLHNTIDPTQSSFPRLVEVFAFLHRCEHRLDQVLV